MPATWLGQRAYIGKVVHVGCKNLIEEIAAAEPATPFHFAVGRIIQKLQEENHVLAFEDGATIPRLAWALRNLSELRILVRYMCQSQANLDRFINDIATSGPSTLRALLRLVNDLAKQVPDPMRATPDQYRQLDSLQRARAEIGLGQDSPLMARTCASKVGLEKEYLAFSSITSPLIHPSAVSVLKTFDLECYRDVLVALGLKLAGDVIEDTRKHIAEFGLKPQK